jgi:hypothetical protein
MNAAVIHAMMPRFVAAFFSSLRRALRAASDRSSMVPCFFLVAARDVFAAAS